MNSQIKKEPKPKYYKNRKCIDCGSKEKVQLVPHPYDSEINGNYDEVFICDHCYLEASIDL